MLFATYQPSSTIEKLGEEPIEPYTIWAVPAENLEDLFLSSFCCAPNRMEALVFFECNHFIRIDKVKWYQAIKDHPSGGISPKDYASEDTDDLHSEFLVETIELKNIKMLVPLFDVGDSPDILTRGSLKLEGEPADYLWGLAATIVDEFQMPAEANMALGMGANYAKYRADFQPKKMAFELVYLPFAYHFIHADPGQITLNVIYLAKMFSYSANSLVRLSNKFTKWSYDDCSLEGFDSIVEEMRHCILDNENVAERLIAGPPIGRNELCPCGSGKKYKKCHGFWLD